jgi:DNA-3-methyladenine glycosylase II
MSPLTARTLRADLGRLARDDADVAAALDRFGYPELRTRPAGFEALLRAIVAQQISTLAAASIWRRIEARFAGFEPAALAAADDDTLRACGLSRQKASYCRSLGAHVARGAVPLDALGALPDEEVVAVLTQVKGIGRWTAEIYAMFALCRRDVWPADDLGLMEGMKRLRRLRQRPNRQRMLRLGEAWRPFRSAGAHLLWHYFHATTDAARAAKQAAAAGKDAR